MTAVYRWGLASCFASCVLACPGAYDGPVTPGAVATYEEHLQGCIVAAKADGGGGRPAALACIQALHESHCGDGGDWRDAGVCEAGVIPERGDR